MPRKAKAAATAPVVEEKAPKKRGRKPAAKKAEPVVETVAETPVVEATPVIEATPAEEVPAKKTRKPRAKKEDKKNTPVLSTVVQVGDAEFDITDITEKAYKAYKSVHKRKVVTDFRVYVKPEENAAYYTVNGEGDPSYKIDL